MLRSVGAGLWGSWAAPLGWTGEGGPGRALGPWQGPAVGGASVGEALEGLELIPTWGGIAMARKRQAGTDRHSRRGGLQAAELDLKEGAVHPFLANLNRTLGSNRPIPNRRS